MSSQKVRLAPPALWGVVLSAMVVLLSACSTTPPAALRGSGDLGVVIERADGNVKVIETTGRSEESERFFPGEKWSRVFPEAGRFEYRCGPHPEMLGVVIVEE